MNIFKQITANDIKNKQLESAKCLFLEHRAAAEHHQALAEMYLERIERLNKYGEGTQNA